MTYINTLLQGENISIVLATIPIIGMLIRYINNHMRYKKRFFNAVRRIDFYYPPDIENIEINQYDIDMSIMSLENILIMHQLYPSTSRKVLEVIEFATYYLSLLKDSRHNKNSLLYCNIYDFTLLVGNFSSDNCKAFKGKYSVQFSKLCPYELCFLCFTLLFFFITLIPCTFYMF